MPSQQKPNKNNKKVSQAYDYKKYAEGYIEAILESPRNKTAALKKAGYKGTYIAQHAAKLHEKLRDRIQEAFEKRKQDFALLGHSVIIDSTKAKNENVVLQAGKSLMDYGGHAVGTTIDLNVSVSNMTDQALDKRILELESRLNETKGISIEGEYEEITDV